MFFKSLFLSLVLFLISTSSSLAATITVSPGESIQSQCLDRVKAGDTCIVNSGTYNQNLTFINSGTPTAPITLKCATKKGCTVENSDFNLVGNKNYYIVDGFRFITSTKNTYPINFYNAIGITLKNSYIEGSVAFEGSNNIVEDSELNGKNTYTAGIRDKFSGAHNNIYRNNTISNYKERGIWSMQRTDNILIEGNTIYNIGIVAIDCDGAANNQTRCFVRNNIIHDISGGGILFENCFDCSAENNTIYNSVSGIGTINYGPISSSDPTGYTEDGIEYRTRNTNLIIRNNLIYNVTNDGINCTGSPGGTAINNTLHKTNTGRSWFGGIGLTVFGDYYCHNWIIKNNLFSEPSAAAIFFESSSTGLENITSNYNFYDFSSTATKFVLKKSGTDAYYNFSNWKSQKYDQNSIIRDASKPLFLDKAAYNFHLSPNSPACASGEGGTYVGAYPCNTVSTKIGDVNNDGMINVIDIGILIDTYSKAVSAYPNSDLNSDGVININDIGMVINNYGK